MTVISLREQVKSGTVAVRALRLKRLENGLAFMINVKGMEENLQNVFDGDKLYLQKRSELWKSGIRVQRELNSQASDFVVIENTPFDVLTFVYVLYRL